jgi:hypothetical protein
VSRARGNAAPNWLAEYVRPWWPYAEATGSGRNGRDITGTPGVAWEVKTADDFKRDCKPTLWVAQARANAGSGEPCPVVYLPRGVGQANIANSLFILPTHWGMTLLEAAGYAPAREA